MGTTVEYVVKACFATSHTHHTLAHAGDAATLVCDEERRLTVALRASRSAAEKRDADVVGANHAAAGALDDSNDGKLVLMALPWQSKALALRVNDVLYDCGDYPVVLTAGDVVRLCRPHMTDDDSHFVIVATINHTADGHCNDDDDDDDGSVVKEYALWRTYYAFRYGSCDDVCTLLAHKGRLTVGLDETTAHDDELQRLIEAQSDAHASELAQLRVCIATTLRPLATRRPGLQGTAMSSPWGAFVAHRRATYG